MATSSDYPAPWIWTVPESNKDPSLTNDDSSNDSAEISFAETLRVVPVKWKKNSAMTSKLFQNRKKPNGNFFKYLLVKRKPSKKKFLQDSYIHVE